MIKTRAVLDAHASHWASVYPEALEAVRARIKNVVSRARIIAQVRLAEARLMPDGIKADTLTAVTEGEGELRHMVLLLTEGRSASGCVLTAFPFAAGAIAHPVRIEQVASVGSGAEGRVRGRTGDGAQLSFFDPLFFKNGSDYRVGESYQFALSGFAYSARPHGLRVVRDADTFVPSDILRPARRGCVDDYEFRATVQHVYPMRVGERTLYRMRVTVARCGQGMVDVALYAAQHVLPAGYCPRPGDEITGALWLQGYLVED